MSGFLKRGAKTVNPAGGVNPAQAPNVGQFGWTSFDANNVNQIIEYVNICKELMEQTKGYADYVEGRFGELEQFMEFIETVYGELKPIIDQIQPIYQDIVFRHEDTITRHIDVIRLHNMVTADKVEINQIKEDAVTETTAIKDATIAESNAIKTATITEVTAIKVLATGEADRAKREADRAAAEAVKSANSATDSAASAIVSGGEAGKAAASAKEAADIAEELRKGQVYRGTWNIESNKAYPSKPDTNSVWDVTLNEGSTQFSFDNTIWYWGDRLLYLKDTDKFTQIESGSGVTSVNGKTGAVTLTAADVGALDKSGDTMTGDLKIGATLTLDNKFVKGTNDSVVLRDHGNGNVTLSAGLSSTGVAGDLYLGYNATAANTAGYNTRNIQVRSPMQWAAGTTIVNESGVNSEFLQGPIRTEKTSGNVYHTIIGGTDTVNRGRTIIAAGECGKAIYDNTSADTEQLHIGGDDTNGINFHTGLQNGWGGSTHHRYWFNQGNLFTQTMPGGTAQKYYHTGNKPQPSELNAVNKAGDTDVGSLTLASGKLLDATLTHQRGYLSVYPYSSGYGLGGASGNRCRMYYKEHNNGNPSDLSRGLVIASTDADGISHSMDIWIGSNKVYHQGYRPTATEVGALPITGGNLTGALRIDHGDYSHRMALAGSTTYYQGGHEVDNADQKLALSGYNGKGLTDLKFIMSDQVTPTVSWGAVNHKVYHEGYKPDLGELIGTGGSTFKTVTLTVPPGVVNGKYYPVIFINTQGYPDVQISTASSSSTSSMNNCSFKGQVLSGGWSDAGRYATGNFVIYDEGERALHSIVGSAESPNHYVMYVEARAFPLNILVNSKVDVTCSGKDAVYGTSTYKAGISNMTASGDYGTKTTLLLDFNRGNGFYGGIMRTAYIDAVGGVNATQRILVDGYNESASFIARRPGKVSYAMMGQNATEEAVFGTGPSVSNYTSYIKVSPSGLGYSSNSTTVHRIYHEGFKPSLGELGGIASTGGTMTGPLRWIDANMYVNGNANNNIYVAAKNGRVVLEGKENPTAVVGANNYTIYHTGYKPSAADVGALPTTGGAITGKLQIYGASSQLELIENDSADKTWRIEAQSNNLDFTESGVATRLRLHAGGGSTFSGNMAVGGHITLNQGNILKFPSANYATGAQMYTRDGGQYGSNFVLNTGGNMVLGAGECGTALADIIGSAATEHAYVAADGDTHIISGANVIGDRKVSRFAANGDMYVNEGSTLARTFYGSADTYVSRSGNNLYIAANGDNGRIFLEGKVTPTVRVGVTDYTIYHSGNLPSFGDLATGKAIGAPQQLGASGTDLDDFKTAGVYYQPGNAGASAGLNYPEPLAGSLVVYLAAGIIQEYRIYNTSRMWRRAQYSTGAWSTWSRDYNSLNKPTAADVGALPMSGGDLTGPLGITTSLSNVVNLNTSSANGAYIIGKQNAVNDWYVGRANANKDVALISYTHGGHGLVIRADRTEFGKDIYVGANRVFREGAQVVAALRKSAFTVNNQASISFQDASQTMFHNYAEVNELKWGTGTDASQIVRMALTAAGQLRISGDLVVGSGGANITGATAVNGNVSTTNGGAFLATGIFRTTRDVPMVEWHKPGVKAYIQYIDSGNALRISTSNGAGAAQATVMALSESQITSSGKYYTSFASGRSWGEMGKAGVFVDNSTINSGNGTLQAGISLYTYQANQYYGESIFGYLHGATWDSGQMVLSSFNQSGNARMTWNFKNNGGFENSSGRWRINSDGNVVASAWGGSTITDWCSRSFAPASDANLKTLLGESKVSALGQVAKMKFHQYVWNDVGFAKESVKVNRLGVVAQEMEEIDANYVRDIETFTEEGEKESIKTLDTANLLAVALKAIQELEAKVASLEEKLNDLV